MYICFAVNDILLFLSRTPRIFLNLCSLDTLNETGLEIVNREDRSDLQYFNKSSEFCLLPLVQLPQELVDAILIKGIDPIGQFIKYVQMFAHFVS